MLDRRAVIAAAAGAAGAAVAIGGMEFFALRAAIPLMAVPFGTSIVLVLGSPEVEAHRIAECGEGHEKSSRAQCRLSSPSSFTFSGPVS